MRCFLLVLVVLASSCGVEPTMTADDAAVSPPDVAAGPADLRMGCSPACAAPTPVCSAQGQCVACIADNDCPAGQICKMGILGPSCVPGCNSDDRCRAGGNASLACCGGRCIDTKTDAQNCGACGQACMSNRAAASCVDGKCTLGMCNPGWADCDADPKNGCEANLQSDAAHCTACGMKCSSPNGIAACAHGCYLAACDFGFEDCNDDAKDGCEVPLQSDPKNCGACKKVCGNVARGQVGCDFGECRIASCDNGYGNCNNTYNDGCETILFTDTRNCGACGKICLQGQICKDGECTCPMCSFPNAKALCLVNQCAIGDCNPGFANCDQQTQNGCETNIYTDRNNCGGCNSVCPQGLVCVLGGCTCQQCNIPNAKSICVNNTCVLDTCLPGFANCDGNANNGCEVDLNSDSANCSACGKPCAQGLSCSLGVCTLCGANVIDNAGMLCVPKGLRHVLDGDKCYGQVIIRGTLAVRPNDGNLGGRLTLRSPSILIEAGGIIDGDAAGSLGGLPAPAQGGFQGAGPGAGCAGGPGSAVGQGGSGGGYGGTGGTAKPYSNTPQCDRCNQPTIAHCHGPAGIVVGTANGADVDIGSGGGAGGNSSGCANSGGRGGNGGASILLLARTIQIDGTVRANGEQPPPDNGACAQTYKPGGGGGSGGAVVLRAETLAGRGTLSANGGQGGNTTGQNGDWGWSGGGGGGGRVKIFAPTDQFMGVTSVSGGLGGTTCGGGQCSVGFAGMSGSTNRSMMIPNPWAAIMCGGL